MLLPQLIIVPLAIIMAQLSDESLAEQVMLASVVAAAAEAQERCHLPGEALAALKYVRAVQPAFDVVSDPGDGKAVHSAIRNVRMLIRNIGAEAWCEFYLLDRPDLMRGRERSGCEGDNAACGPDGGLRRARTLGGEAIPVAVSLGVSPL